MILEATKLGKRYGERWLFRNLSFSLSQGDGLIVLGRNGAGKSTLLKAIAGLVSPSAGKINLDVSDVRTGLGMAALEMSLYPALTLREHLVLAGELRGCPPRTDEMLDRISLQASANLLASQISTGMKARLKIALAIQSDPAILLLDEPGAGLDEAGREFVREVCVEQRQRGVLILATNDAREKQLGNLEMEVGE